jgi:hypothetical protein
MTGYHLSKIHAGKHGDSIPWQLRGMIRHLVAYLLPALYQFPFRNLKRALDNIVHA